MVLSLEDALARTSALRDHGLLSLRQLVPVYEAILGPPPHSVEGGTTAQAPPPQAQASLPAAIESSSETDAERLLRVLYHLRQQHDHDRAKCILDVCLIPRRRRCWKPATDTADDNSTDKTGDDDETEGRASLYVSDELRDALLDTIWPIIHKDDAAAGGAPRSIGNKDRDNSNDEDDAAMWATLVQHLTDLRVTTTTNENDDRDHGDNDGDSYWTMAGAILARWATVVSTTAGQAVLRRAVAAHVTEAWTAALASSTTTTTHSCHSSSSSSSSSVRWPSLLRSWTVHSLPSLVALTTSRETATAATDKEDGDDAAAVLTDLWTRIWSHWKDDNENHDRDSLVDRNLPSCTCLTTVLCVLLPSFLTILPSSTSVVKDERLWSLIHHCLRLGNEDGGGRKRSHATTTTTATNIPSGATAAFWFQTTLTPDALRVLLRRRGLYLLHVLVEHETTTTRKPQQLPTLDAEQLSLWSKYVACFQVLEMELEGHLVDQIWETMQDLCEAMVCPNDSSESGTSTEPRVSWRWIRLVLGRAIISKDMPVLRKLCLYRLLIGQAGIRLVDRLEEAESTLSTKKKSKQRSSKRSNAPRGAPLLVVSVEFLFDVIVPAFDTLHGSVGTNMCIEANSGAIATKSGGKTKQAHDMVELLRDFVSTYFKALLMLDEGTEKDNRLEDFVRRLWSLSGIRDDTKVDVFTAVRTTLEATPSSVVPVCDDMLRTICEAFTLANSDGSMVIAYRNAQLHSVAVTLEYSKAADKLSPISILHVLALYPVGLLDGESVQEPMEDKDGLSWIERNASLASLRTWLAGGRNGSVDAIDHSSIGATVATAFVDGLLLGDSTKAWDPQSGCRDLERSTAKAICLLCTLPSYDTTSAKTVNPASTASALLWPAIHKGLVHAPTAIMGSSWLKADRVSRALLLLTNGCRLRVLSGMGNGDLVVDKKTEQMMPPPPNIESMLGNCISFLVHHIRSLMATADDLTAEVETNTGSLSTDARVLSLTFSRLVGQLKALAEGFLSSMAISSTIDEILAENMKLLIQDDITDQKSNKVQQITLLYATLSCDGAIDSSQAFDCLKSVLRLKFGDSWKVSRNVQAARSVFQYAKWGALSILLESTLKSSERDENAVNSFVEELFNEAADVVESVPANALVPVFTCIATAAKPRLQGQESLEPRYLEKVIKALFALVNESTKSGDSMYMIDEICSLIFQPSLLVAEYKRLQEDGDSLTPVRDAFRHLIKLAGSQRPHISRCVLSRICASWLQTTSASKSQIALSAIPYKDDIAMLLLQKENHVPITCVSTFDDCAGGNKLQLAGKTDDTSISRGFLLVFLSKLPNVDNDLSSQVVVDLINPIIKEMLITMARPPPAGSGLIMHGTTEYCKKIRALQTLVILSRFVTVDLAELVCETAFKAMGKQTSHNQLRYFIEIFTLQCSRKYPSIFGKKLFEEITRTDLPLQKVASLMIIAGNLVVGRYEKDFFRQFAGDSENAVKQKLHHLLSGVIPWLASTQGFSRAISQMLAFKLIPMVMDVEKTSSKEDTHWYLRSIYKFLDENEDMTRLRKKQAKFFSQYEVDAVCTPEGVFAIPIDEGNEASPKHMVEVIKECLKEVYEEVHIGNAPLWKQLEAAEALEQKDQDIKSSTDDVVNFQRKIIPLDALNLALEEAREKRLRNVAGRRKQDLIVCASLIDKVPNLGGLARTSEIFAANRLVVPDIMVTKMDNFKTLCVGAGDWIEIEECPPKDLLSWLRERRQEGFHIVGLEQTSSSVSLSNYEFPNKPTILLLGKEKEGIPVEFLQAVDQCLEIPQLGIIRSLNVHVSGAIAIWEFTKQKLASGSVEP